MNRPLRGYRHLLLCTLVLAGVILLVRWRPLLNSMGDLTDNVQPIELAPLLHDRRADRIMLVDCRSAAEYREGHIPRSINPRSPNGLDPAGRSLVLYASDANSPRLYALARNLARANRGVVYVYSGGMREWRQCGLPEDRTTP